MPVLGILTPANASVVAASVALVSAVVVFWLNRRAGEVERKRTECAQAMADAIEWLELPYRVRRRTDDGPATLGALTERFHSLHEKLLLHEQWMLVEIPTAHPLYQTLVTSVRQAAHDAIRKAWEAEPVQKPSGMNTGNLGIDRSKVDTALATFAAEVRKRLRILPPW